MKQKQFILLLVQFVAVFLSFSLPVFAEEDVVALQAPLYENAVPKDWQMLVSKEAYDFAATYLLEFNKKLDAIVALTREQIGLIAASPCQKSLVYLAREYQTNPRTPKALERVAAGIQKLPLGYEPRENPWKSSSADEIVAKMLIFFSRWCTNLPQINGSYDTGLDDIQHVSWLYYHNISGQNFVQGRDPNDPSKPLLTGRKFTMDFTMQLGAFTDTAASTTYVSQWMEDPIIEMQDYQKQKVSDYKTWNQFFARELITDTENETIPSRPVTMPERDYVVVAPTDCIMNPLVQVITKDGKRNQNLLKNPLQYNTVLDVKGIPISVDELLTGVREEYREKFVGGTGQSCVLMPNTYHHFHAPVDGTIVHASIIRDNTYGYYDWPNWVPSGGNVGRPGADFSQMQAYQRGIIIIEIKYRDISKGSNVYDKVSTGYVAVIPVGLESIGSVVLNEGIEPGAKVKKGYTELGNFFYGGSLNILLYSKGLAGGVTKVRMGNQINVLKLGNPIEE